MTEKDYEMRIKELICRAEDAELDANQYADICKDYERQLAENEKEIARLKGMIEAFKICIIRGDKNAR